MPSDLEIAAAEKAARSAAPGMGGFSARTIVTAALAAAERVRAEQQLAIIRQRPAKPGDDPPPPR